jgi:homoserine O-acetyltransferase
MTLATGISTGNGTHPRRTPEASSVGIVQRRSAHFDHALPLLSGQSLERFTIAYETYGELTDTRDNAILICHALSGDAHVAGYYTDDPDEKPGWWDEAVGPGKMFDTECFCVICANVIGGCQGSTGPSSLAPDGKPYGSRFPLVTVADMVLAQRYLLDALGIETLFAAVGGSMGAMQARSSAQNIAFNAIGREAIYADPNWKGGDYYDGQAPEAGLAVARMVGHITYMSERSLESKFGRSLQDHDSLPYRLDVPEFTVESYLQYQGEKFIRRFDANSYLVITKALDYFDIADGYVSMEAALAHVTAHFLVVSFSSDWLYTAAQGRELVQALENNGKPVEHHIIQADFGHDSFLVEVETMTHLVGGYLTRAWEEYRSDELRVKS